MWLIDRVVPTLLMAASAALLTAGVLSYAPSAFGDWRTAEPVIGGGDPLFESPGPTLGPGETAQPTQASPDGTSSIDLPSDQPPSSVPTDGTPTGTPSGPPSTFGPPTSPPTAGPPTVPPSSRPGPAQRGFASRIRIPSLNVDLPVVPSDLVVAGNRGFYPLCDVAMYMTGFVQPGESGSTYIYAHAQRGMFLPLLRASLNDDGASMIGSLVEVYTSDNKVHLYEIVRVKRHAMDLSITRVAPGVHQLVLQTSEGYSGHIPKLQIAARPIAVLPASRSEVNSRPDPRVCLPRN